MLEWQGVPERGAETGQTEKKGMGLVRFMIEFVKGYANLIRKSGAKTSEAYKFPALRDPKQETPEEIAVRKSLQRWRLKRAKAETKEVVSSEEARAQKIAKIRQRVEAMRKAKQEEISVVDKKTDINITIAGMSKSR